jgi:hypothetical protein
MMKRLPHVCCAADTADTAWVTLFKLLLLLLLRGTHLLLPVPPELLVRTFIHSHCLQQLPAAASRQLVVLLRGHHTAAMRLQLLLALHCCRIELSSQVGRGRGATSSQLLL